MIVLPFHSLASYFDSGYDYIHVKANTVFLHLAINPCSEHLCTQLCLLSGLRPRYYTCHCQSGWKLDADKRTCVKGILFLIHQISQNCSYLTLILFFLF